MVLQLHRLLFRSHPTRFRSEQVKLLLGPNLLRRVYELCTSLWAIKRQIWPLRRQIAMLLRRSQRRRSDEALDGFCDLAQHVDPLVDQAEILCHQCDVIITTSMANRGSHESTHPVWG